MRFAPVLLIAACHHGATAPPAASCAGVADHVYAMLPQDDHGRSVREAVATRCAKDAWPVAARDCMMVTKTLHDGHHCKDRLTAEQRGALDSDLEAIEKKRAAQLPPECVRYGVVMARLAGCDKLPQMTRDALQQGFEATSRRWVRYADQPREGKRATIEECKQGIELAEQYGKAVCNW